MKHFELKCSEEIKAIGSWCLVKKIKQSIGGKIYLLANFQNRFGKKISGCSMLFTIFNTFSQTLIYDRLFFLFSVRKPEKENKPIK